MGDLLLSRLDELGVEIVGPHERGLRSHIYVLKLPVEKWADYFARNAVRVTPERGGLRVSFAMFNTIEDVERLVDIIRAGLLENTRTVVANVD